MTFIKQLDLFNHRLNIIYLHFLTLNFQLHSTDLTAADIPQIIGHKSCQEKNNLTE